MFPQSYRNLTPNEGFGLYCPLSSLWLYASCTKFQWRAFFHCTQHGKQIPYVWRDAMKQSQRGEKQEPFVWGARMRLPIPLCLAVMSFKTDATMHTLFNVPLYTFSRGLSIVDWGPVQLGPFGCGLDQATRDLLRLREEPCAISHAPPVWTAHDSL